MGILSLLNARHCMYLISLSPTTPAEVIFGIVFTQTQRRYGAQRFTVHRGQSMNSNLSLSFPRARRCFPPQHVT